MSRNGSGTYNLPSGNPVVSGSTITSSWANTTLTDIATALTGSVASDGQTPMSGALNMTDNLITNVADPVANQDAATKLYTDTAIATAVATVEAEITLNSVPVGAIQMWSTATAPTGYLLCTGSAVSRTTYSALFAVISTTFGVGDGSTTFNLPNYTNRMPYGTTLASTGGSADSIVVSHTHTATSTVTDPSHTHSGVVVGQTSVGGSGTGNQLAGNNVVSIPSATTGITVGTSISTTGSSGTNANLPPYLGINFIIKA